MKKILFLHGFYASGQCVPAVALREAFAGKAEVLTPDLPMHPQDALETISELQGDFQGLAMICSAVWHNSVWEDGGKLYKLD